LEPYQLVLVQELLEKKWKEVKRDLIYEDDTHTMRLLIKILCELRSKDEANTKKYIKIQNKEIKINRHRSPVLGRYDVKVH